MNSSCFAVVVNISVIYSLLLFFSVLTCLWWQADNGDVKIIDNLALNCCAQRNHSVDCKTAKSTSLIWEYYDFSQVLQSSWVLASIHYQGQGKDLAIRTQGQSQDLKMVSSRILEAKTSLRGQQDCMLPSVLRHLVDCSKIELWSIIWRIACLLQTCRMPLHLVAEHSLCAVECTQCGCTSGSLCQYRHEFHLMWLNVFSVGVQIWIKSRMICVSMICYILLRHNHIWFVAVHCDGIMLQLVPCTLSSSVFDASFTVTAMAHQWYKAICWQS